MSAAIQNLWYHNLICQVAQGVQKYESFESVSKWIDANSGKDQCDGEKGSNSAYFSQWNLFISSHNYLTSHLVLIAESFDVCLLPAPMVRRDPTAIQLHFPSETSSHLLFRVNIYLTSHLVRIGESFDVACCHTRLHKMNETISHPNISKMDWCKFWKR